MGTGFMRNKYVFDHSACVDQDKVGLVQHQSPVIRVHGRKRTLPLIIKQEEGKGRIGRRESTGPGQDRTYLTRITRILR